MGALGGGSLILSCNQLGGSSPEPVAITLLCAVGIIGTVSLREWAWSMGVTWGLWTSPAA